MASSTDSTRPRASAPSLEESPIGLGARPHTCSPRLLPGPHPRDHRIAAVSHPIDHPTGPPMPRHPKSCTPLCNHPKVQASMIDHLPQQPGPTSHHASEARVTISSTVPRQSRSRRSTNPKGSPSTLNPVAKRPRNQTDQAWLPVQSQHEGIGRTKLNSGKSLHRAPLDPHSSQACGGGQGVEAQKTTRSAIPACFKGTHRMPFCLIKQKALRREEGQRRWRDSNLQPPVS